MRTEKGTVEFTNMVMVEDKETGKVLVQERTKSWTGISFPGGHVEQFESITDSARREVKEETGLDVTFVTGFRAEDEHNLAREGRPHTIKQTVYFLAEYRNQNFVPQESEISKIELLDFESAMAALQFDSFKHILAQAHSFLTQNESIRS